jgi:hypothetical protein
VSRRYVDGSPTTVVEYLGPGPDPSWALVRWAGVRVYVDRVRLSRLRPPG